MKQKLLKVFEDYSALLQYKCGNIELRNNKEMDLVSLINGLETDTSFHNLIKETRCSFSEFEPNQDMINHLDINRTEWGNRVKNFFRRSNIYYDIYIRNNIDIVLEFKRYVDAFQRNEINETYLLPLEYISFAEDDMDFSQFQIRKYNSKGLNDMFQSNTNKIFYHNAFIDVNEIEE